VNFGWLTLHTPSQRLQMVVPAAPLDRFFTPLFPLRSKTHSSRCERNEDVFPAESPGLPVESLQAAARPCLRVTRGSLSALIDRFDYRFRFDWILAGLRVEERWTGVLGAVAEFAKTSVLGRSEIRS
jgi:hypothetical protein